MPNRWLSLAFTLFLVEKGSSLYSYIPLSSTEIEDLTIEVNIERCIHGKSPITWSPEFMEKAEKNCNGEEGALGSKENRVFIKLNDADGDWRTGMAVDLQKSMYNRESANYDYGTGRKISSAGAPIHDFAQSVWKPSVLYGCAVCEDTSEDYTSFVCNYDNWITDFDDYATSKANIHKPSRSRGECTAIVKPSETYTLSLNIPSLTMTNQMNSRVRDPITNPPVSSHPWRCVGLKFRSSWPKQLSSWIPKLISTLYRAWPTLPIQPFSMRVTFVCPLVKGEKPFGDEAKRLCTSVDSSLSPSKGRRLLAESMAELLSIGKNDGVFVEVEMTDDDVKQLDSRTATISKAAEDAFNKKPPLYDPNNPPNLLLMDVLPMRNNDFIIITQEGSAGSNPNPNVLENLKEPLPKSNTPSWWIYLIVGVVLVGLSAGVLSLLVMKKRSAASRGGGSITVSDFYTSLPEGYAAGPIPEEHYGNDEYNSSVEIECYSRPRNISLGLIQPLGRI